MLRKARQLQVKQRKIRSLTQRILSLSDKINLIKSLIKNRMEGSKFLIKKILRHACHEVPVEQECKQSLLLSLVKLDARHLNHVVYVDLLVIAKGTKIVGLLVLLVRDLSFRVNNFPWSTSLPWHVTVDCFSFRNQYVFLLFLIYF